MGDKLDIGSTPCTHPEADEIVIKNRAWVINPVNWISQQTSLFDGLKYPLILRGDIAGEVVEVGSGVTHFKKGDRAFEMPLGLGLSKPSEGDFQLYRIVHAVLAASVPDSMSYTEATVFPLCLSTAACSLF